MREASNGQIVSIKPSDNGPLLVKGPVHLVDIEGNEYPIEGNIALCRCGASQSKPFCDGSHRRIGFKSVVRAPVIERNGAELEPVSVGA